MMAAIARWVLAHVIEQDQDRAMARLCDWVFADRDNEAYAAREGFTAAWRAMERDENDRDQSKVS